MQQKARLTEGPVARTLVRLTMPMVIAMFAMVGFNLIDTFYVGQLGTEQLAAMGFTLAVVMAVNSISQGLGMGATAVVAKAIGRRDTEGVRRLTLGAILLGVTVASTITVAGLLTIDPLFGALGAEGVVLEHVHAYMSIWFLGLPLIIVPQTGNSGLRATGDTKTPAKIMIAALGINAVLDPLFIFGFGPVPAFGLRGAAIATVIAQACALVLALGVLRRRGILTRVRMGAGELLASWRRVLAVGLPAAVTQLITPVSTGVITAIVATYGVAAVAGFGVAGRLEMFAVMVINALGAALVPFVGQNWGAGNKARVSRAVKVALGMAAGWGAFVWVLSLVGGRAVAGVFNDDATVIATVVSYMAIVFPSYALLGALVTITNSLNALHRAVHSLVLSVLRMFVLYVPLAYAGSVLYGLTGVWWAALVANGVAGVVGVLWFRHLFRRMEAEAPVTEWAEEPEFEVIPA
ncbi:MAG: MATE family efflux transporter [Coriobacteriia bacterium]|nr:MATE family efflux transporter [Coriobacteriia bacterium]